MKKKQIGSVVLMSTLLLSGCGTSTTVKTKTTAFQVVACSRSLGDMWQLAGGHLTGVTIDGKDLGKHIPIVGTLMRPNVEKIVALKPSKVLLTGDIPTQQKVKASLTEANVKVESVDVNNFHDYDKYMKEFTTENHRQDLYKKNVTDVKTRIDQIKKKVKFKKQTYLMIRVSSMKNKVLKKDYFATEIADAMHMQNIADDSSHLSEINVEEVVKKNPDYIFVIYQGEAKQAKAAYAKVAKEPGWSDLSAVKNKKVKVLPKNYFQFKPNAQWDKAYAYLYDYLS